LDVLPGKLFASSGFAPCQNGNAFVCEFKEPASGLDLESGSEINENYGRAKYNRTILLPMSYDLISRSTILCRTFSRQFWAKALELAALYGWKPIGTRPPSYLDFYQIGAEWDGRYSTNDGQTVKAEDARSLAAALERSLKDISDKNLPMDWDALVYQGDDLPEWLSPEERETIEESLQDGLLDIMGMSPLDYFAGDEKQHLREFIRFCRLGSFEIL
jgi:hypothetical protein